MFPAMFLEIVNIQSSIFADEIGCACQQSQIGIINAVFVSYVSNFHNLFSSQILFSTCITRKTDTKEIYPTVFL